MIGFFGAACGPCRDHLPAFIAETARLGPDHVIAVAVGSADSGADLIEVASRGGVTVTVEPEHGPISAYINVRASPNARHVRAAASVPGEPLLV